MFTLLFYLLRFNNIRASVNFMLKVFKKNFFPEVKFINFSPSTHATRNTFHLFNGKQASKNISGSLIYYSISQFSPHHINDECL